MTEPPTAPASDPSTSPQLDPPRVHAIHVAKARRLPTRTVPEVEAEAGRGLVGDRYHGSKHRHVTVQTLTDLAAASAELGSDIDPGLTRRNVTLTHGDLPTRPGSFLTIGDVELQVLRIAAPCRLLDDWIAPGAMRSMHGRGGVVCRLLTSGTIRVGDEARWPMSDGTPEASRPTRQRTSR